LSQSLSKCGKLTLPFRRQTKGSILNVSLGILRIFHRSPELFSKPSLDKIQIGGSLMSFIESLPHAQNIVLAWGSSIQSGVVSVIGAKVDWHDKIILLQI
jgi:hypothetical protein